MKYYKLLYNYENSDDYIFCDIDDIGDLDEYCTVRGKRIDDWKELTLEYDSKEGEIISDYISNAYGWFMVSDEFVSAVENILGEQDYQLLPVKIFEKSGAFDEIDCQIFNILDMVEDAIDLDTSIYDVDEMDGEEFLLFVKYVLKREKVEGHDLFRLKEEELPIFVSERIKEIIETNEMKGFSFLEIKLT